MKTIGEASIEYVKSNFLLETIWAQETQDAFKSGAEFAQRWVSVEEELPEKFKQVIAKLENGWHTCTWIMEDGTFAFNVKPTHWRPIEIK